MQKEELVVYPNTPQIQGLFNQTLIHPMSAFVARSNHKYNQVLRNKQQRIIIQQTNPKGSQQKRCTQHRNASLPKAVNFPRQNLQIESLLLQPKHRLSLAERQKYSSLKERDDGFQSLLFKDQKEELKIEKLQKLQRKLQTSNDELLDENLKQVALKLTYHESKQLIQQLKTKNLQDADKTKLILQNILTGMQHKLDEVTTEKHMKIFGMQIKTFNKLNEYPTVRSKAISQEKERENSKSFVICNEEIVKRKEIQTPQQPKRKQSPSKMQNLVKTNPNFKFSLTDYSQMSREQLFQTKLVSYHHFLFLVSSQSNFYSQPMCSQIELKFKIGRGNNSFLLKETFKNRWWWNMMPNDTENKEMNFIWTQIKVPQFMGCQEWSSGQQSFKRSETQSSIEMRKKQSSFHNSIKKKEKQEKFGCEYPIHKLMNASQAIEVSQVEKSVNDYVKYGERNQFKYLSLTDIKIHNHIERNYHLGNKKALYYNMKRYYEISGQDLFKHLPITFHIQKGSKDKAYTQFLDYYKSFGKKKSTWIVKPGEFTNRGNGIIVCQSLGEIHKIISKKQTHPNGKMFTYLIQKYIEKPLLYNKRKFDIRCFFLITQINNVMRAYWYEEGYLRTSCEEFDLKDPTNQYIHLTNDAIQKYADDYGKYENGNKLSFSEFQRYLDMWHANDKVDFYKDIYPQLKQIATNAIRAVYPKLEPYKRDHNFEVFGLDFMIDDQFNPFLIEINTNPCLELSSPLLTRLIPAMIENALRLSIDTIVQPPESSVWPPCKKHLLFYDNVLENNRFHLIFDDRDEGQKLKQSYDHTQNEEVIDDMDEEEEEYKSDDD